METFQELENSRQRVAETLHRYETTQSVIGTYADLSNATLALPADLDQWNIADMLVSDPLLEEDRADHDYSTMVGVLDEGRRNMRAGIEMKRNQINIRIEKMLHSFQKTREQEEKRAEDMVDLIQKKSGFNKLQVKLHSRKEFLENSRRELEMKKMFVDLQREDSEITPDQLRLKLEEMAETKLRECLKVLDDLKEETTALIRKKKTITAEIEYLKENIGKILLSVEDKVDGVKPSALGHALGRKLFMSNFQAVNIDGDLLNEIQLKIDSAVASLQHVMNENVVIVEKYRSIEARMKATKEEMDKALNSDDNKALKRLNVACAGYEADIEKDQKRLALLENLFVESKYSHITKNETAMLQLHAECLHRKIRREQLVRQKQDEVLLHISDDKHVVHGLNGLHTVSSNQRAAHTEAAKPAHAMRSLDDAGWRLAERAKSLVLQACTADNPSPIVFYSESDEIVNESGVSDRYTPLSDPAVQIPVNAPAFHSSPLLDQSGGVNQSRGTGIASKEGGVDTIGTQDSTWVPGIAITPYAGVGTGAMEVFPPGSARRLDSANGMNFSRPQTKMMSRPSSVLAATSSRPQSILQSLRSSLEAGDPEKGEVALMETDYGLRLAVENIHALLSAIQMDPGDEVTTSSDDLNHVQELQNLKEEIATRSQLITELGSDIKATNDKKRLLNTKIQKLLIQRAKVRAVLIDILEQAGLEVMDEKQQLKEEMSRKEDKEIERLTTQIEAVDLEIAKWSHSVSNVRKTLANIETTEKENALRVQARQRATMAAIAAQSFISGEVKMKSDMGVDRKQTVSHIPTSHIDEIDKLNKAIMSKRKPSVNPSHPQAGTKELSNMNVGDRERDRDRAVLSLNSSRGNTGTGDRAAGVSSSANSRPLSTADSPMPGGTRPPSNARTLTADRQHSAESSALNGMNDGRVDSAAETHFYSSKRQTQLSRRQSSMNTVSINPPLAVDLSLSLAVVGEPSSDFSAEVVKAPPTQSKLVLSIHETVPDPGSHVPKLKGSAFSKQHSDAVVVGAAETKMKKKRDSMKYPESTRITEVSVYDDPWVEPTVSPFEDQSSAVVVIPQTLDVKVDNTELVFEFNSEFVSDPTSLTYNTIMESVLGVKNDLLSKAPSRKSSEHAGTMKPQTLSAALMASARVFSYAGRDEDEDALEVDINDGDDDGEGDEDMFGDKEYDDGDEEEVEDELYDSFDQQRPIKLSLGRRGARRRRRKMRKERKRASKKRRATASSVLHVLVDSDESDSNVDPSSFDFSAHNV